MKLSKEQKYILNDAKLIESISYEELLRLIENRNMKELDSGAFAACYTNNIDVIKRYFTIPYLNDSTGEIFQDSDDVVKNLINLSTLRNEHIATPKKFFIYEDELLGYEMKFMRGKTPDEILEDNENIKVDDLKIIVDKTYDLASFFSNKKIVMYDFGESNFSIDNKDVNIFDMDFYIREKNNKDVYSTNLFYINVSLTNFLERYFFEENLDLDMDNYYSPNFVDDVLYKLNDITGIKAKTLNEIKNKLKGK